MQSKAAIGIFIFGILLGGSGGWLVKPQPMPTSTPKSTVPVGWKQITLDYDEQRAIQLQIRETDRVARLKDNNKIIGFKVFDLYSNTTAIDIVTERVEEYFDLPNATDLDEYKENREGLSIQQNREAAIHGQPAVKQLYTAVLGQKRGDGAVIKRSQANLMRYVIEGPEDHFLILKANAALQTYLDTVALSIEFVSKSSLQNEPSINLEGDGEIDVNPVPVSSDLFEQESGISIQ